MRRWLICLVGAVLFEALGLLLCGILPLFRVYRFGPIDNRSGSAVVERLPLWLAWFDTPDNGLMGDANHQARHANSSRYWTMVCWLARNRAYGFKWSILAAPATPWVVSLVWGDERINRNNGITGRFYIRMESGYWQWKLVKKLYKDWGVMLNFGWMLDPYVSNPALTSEQPRALFLFSPRPVRIK